MKSTDHELDTNIGFVTLLNHFCFFAHAICSTKIFLPGQKKIFASQK